MRAKRVQKCVEDGRCPDCRRGWIEWVQVEKSDFGDGCPIIHAILECEYCNARIKSQLEIIPGDRDAE